MKPLILSLLLIFACKAKERPKINETAQAEPVQQLPCDIKPNEQKWEIVKGETPIIRLKVCGGWLIKTNRSSSSMFTFYEDKEHLW